MRNFVTKVNDTAPLASGLLDAAEDNVRFEELENAVTRGGITLDAAGGPDTSNEMLAESMTRHSSGAVFGTDSGAANAYVVAMAGPYKEPGALFDGLRVDFVPAAANTTASTLNAFGLGVKPIVDYQSLALAAGAIDGKQTTVYWRSDIGAGSWYLPRWADARYVANTPSATPTISSGEGWTINVSNEGDLDFPKLTNEANLADADLFAFFDQSETHHRNITWAQMVAALATANSGGLLNIQMITTSSTYTKTTGANKALVMLVGGGGGGGAGGDASGGGGGGGGAISLVDISLLTTVACTIGAGGVGGTGSATGGNGGETAFGDYVKAGGGKGGMGTTGNQVVGGDGGVGTVGLLKFAGTAGGAGMAYAGGAGGASFFGGGGRGGNVHVNLSDGAPGGNYGGGGGGGEAQGGTGRGGNGASGAIMILEFA